MVKKQSEKKSTTASAKKAGKTAGRSSKSEQTPAPAVPNRARTEMKKGN